MGWWSTDIMGGDTPLDFKSAILDQIGLDEFKAKPEQIRKAFDSLDEKTLREVIPAIVNEWGCGDPGGDFYKNEVSIGFQVLAVLMMESGARISPGIQGLMDVRIMDDDWAKEDDERKGKIKHLLQTLRSYSGEPVEVKSKGLLEVLAGRINLQDQ